MTILKEDYRRWCDKCAQAGSIKVAHEEEKYGGKVTVYEYELCPKCLGALDYLDKDKYINALEHRIKELEEDESMSLRIRYEKLKVKKRSFGK